MVGSSNQSNATENRLQAEGKKERKKESDKYQFSLFKKATKLGSLRRTDEENKGGPSMKIATCMKPFIHSSHSALAALKI
jgi:hypothetical protein